MAANASVAVARLGGNAAYWGRVGTDEVGTRIITELVAEGVDISDLRRVSGAMSSSDAILVDPRGAADLRLH
jgi:sulfofructose kinase